MRKREKEEEKLALQKKKGRKSDSGKRIYFISVSKPVGLYMSVCVVVWYIYNICLVFRYRNVHECCNSNKEK